MPFKFLPESYSPPFADNFEVKTNIKLKLSHKEFSTEEILIFTDLKENNVKVTIMLFSSEISPTRCNNCVFILRNGLTLHVSGDNLTHHQEYICCIWPQVSRLT